jgi:hypothetical protein
VSETEDGQHQTATDGRKEACIWQQQQDETQKLRD